MPRQPRRTWTAKDDEDLMRYHAEGLSSAAISQAMVWPSRNSVIGRIDRLKKMYTKTNYSVKKAVVVKERKPFGGFTGKKKPQPPPKPVTDTSAFVPYADLKPGQCQWGETVDGAVVFCGCAVDRGVYCGWHYERAHIPKRAK